MKRAAAIWAARTGALQRLGSGHAALQHRTLTALTAWVRRGRRDDLEGLAAALGCWLRLAALAAAGAGLYLAVRTWPRLMWILTAIWAIAAWRAAAAPRPAKEAAPETPEAAPVEPLLYLLRAFIGIRPGVHLSTLLEHLQKHGQGEGWTVADLRARLEACGVPVRRSVKVDGRVAYGVHRTDVPAPSPAPAGEPAA